MVVLIRGESTCPLCGQVLATGDEVVGFPHFLDREHRLWRFSDSAMHARCFETWAEKEEFDALYADAEAKRRALATPERIEELRRVRTHEREVRSRQDGEQVAPDHPHARALLDAYFDELRERFGSFEAPSLEELRADAARGVVLVAHDEDGRAIGCGSLRLLEPGTGEVKRMFVVAHARGQGHARRLLHALEERARTMGCQRVVLDTAAPLVEAARMYLREGYLEIARYNANPYAARWFEKSLL